MFVYNNVEIELHVYSSSENIKIYIIFLTI